MMAVLDLSDTIQSELMINVIHLLKSEFSYSVSIIDQSPLAKVAALILHVTEHLVSQLTQINSKKMNSAISAREQRTDEFEEASGTICR